MKKILLATGLLLAFSTAAYAEMYKWTDEKGVIHIVDSIHKVPVERRGETPKIEGRGDTIPVNKPETTQDNSPALKEQRARPGVDVYDGKPITWWQARFDAFNRDISELKQRIRRKERFLSVLESGRRAGQIFKKSDIDTYNKYKSDIIKDQAALAKMEKERDSLKRKARTAGVPRKVRGD